MMRYVDAGKDDLSKSMELSLGAGVSNPPVGLPLTPGGCQIGYVCDQNSTDGLHSLPGGVRL
jgi:hypothetical protein